MLSLLNEGLRVMKLHIFTMFCFFFLSSDARKYLSVTDQSKVVHSRSSLWAAGKNIIFDEITPNNHDTPLDSSSATSLAPISLPGNTPINCLYPPTNNPQTPPATVISPPSGSGGYDTPSEPVSSYPYIIPPPNQQSYPPPVVPNPNPPMVAYPSPTGSSYPYIFPPPNQQSYPPPVVSNPNPPMVAYPSPTGSGGGYNTPPSPPQMGPTPATPSYIFPSPPPSSPTIINVPTIAPPIYVPGPTVFLPPVVYPPPAVPPPPYIAPPMALWCVAKPSVPDPILQEAMNYACGSGADCGQIQPNGSCFSPDSLITHASYAFNSYWQRTKVAGGTCEFGGTAILVTVDPSYDGCHFIYF